jgi:hypothetical protein
MKKAPRDVEFVKNEIRERIDLVELMEFIEFTVNFTRCTVFYKFKFKGISKIDLAMS